jgi:hypothetical protein
MGASRARRAIHLTNSVRDDWFAWLPNEMDGLFDATRNELECSNAILSVALDEGLKLCDRGEYVLVREQAVVFAELFDRLAERLCLVIRNIEEHSSRFGTLPNVTALVHSNFRGNTAQRISRMSSLLARVVLRARSRFFHKLQSLKEIIEYLQGEVRETVEACSNSNELFPTQAWRELEVLGYDLNTCMSETTVILKSFFCVLPDEELDGFRQKLALVPGLTAIPQEKTRTLQEE